MSAKHDQMCNLIGRFDSDWCKDFKSVVNADPNGQKMIAASNSLVTNRHNFAHGKSPTAIFMDSKCTGVIPCYTLFRLGYNRV